MDALSSSERQALMVMTERVNVFVLAKLFGVDFRTLSKAAFGQEVHAYTALCIRNKLKELSHADQQ